MAPSLFGVVFVFLFLGTGVDSSDGESNITLSFDQTYFQVEPYIDHVDIPIKIKFGFVASNITVKLYEVVNNGPDILTEEKSYPRGNLFCHDNWCPSTFRVVAKGYGHESLHYFNVSSYYSFDRFWRFHQVKQEFKVSPFIKVERKLPGIQLTKGFPDQFIASGTHVIIACKTDLAKPAIEIVWKRKFRRVRAEDITNNKYYNIFTETIPATNHSLDGSGHSESTLQFFARREDRYEEFFCEAKDNPGIKSPTTHILFKQYTLSVEIEGKIEHQHILKLSCKVTTETTETPAFQWVYTGHTRSQISASTPDLSVTFSNHHEDGLYTCHVNTRIRTGSASYFSVSGKENLAMGKPTWQSVDHYDDGTGKSSNAVDGERNPDFFGGMSCTHTMEHYYAWWAVDLGKITGIYSVGIKNRADCCSSRLTNFQIGTTSNAIASPEKYMYWPLSNRQKYNVCANQDEPLGAGEYKTFRCTAVARYVIVQLKGKGLLTLCEVEVFGIPRHGGLNKYIGCFKDVSDNFALDQAHNSSRIMTVENCLDRCSKLNTSFAGLEAGIHCFCGNAYDKYGPADNCNMKCSGNSNQICGGLLALSVYLIGGTANIFESGVSHEVIVNNEPVRGNGSSVLTGGAWVAFAVFLTLAILVTTTTGFIAYKKWSKGTGENLAMAEVQNANSGHADNFEMAEGK